MRVMVTGGAGYIGSHMVLGLLDRGDDVFVLDNLSTGFREAVPDGVSFFSGDVGDEAFVTSLLAEHRIDAIVHFAASLIVPESVADPLGYYFNNTVKSRALIAAAVAVGVKRFVFSSTAAVYGSPTTIPIDESVPPSPESPYGSSKWMTEMILRDVAAVHDFRYAALRYFNVAGADEDMRAGQRTKNATHLIKVACQAATGQRPGLSVFGTDYPTADGTGVRDYIHVTDLIAAHLVALDRLADGSDSFVANCGYGHGYSVLQVIEAIKRISNVAFDVGYAPRRPGDPAEVVAKAERMRSMGWTPNHDDLDKVVQTALDWERRLLVQTV